MTTTDLRRKSYVRGEGSGKVLCPHCPPGRGQFGSETAFQNHLRSGVHQRRSSSREVSNQRDRPEEQGSIPETVSASARNTAGNRSSVDLAQWAQTIGQTLTGMSPASFSVDMIQEIDTNLQQTQCLLPSRLQQYVLTR